MLSILLLGRAGASVSCWRTWATVCLPAHQATELDPQATLVHPAPLKAAIPLTDAETVAAAQSAGAGAMLDLAVGGKLTPGFAPLAVRARVARPERRQLQDARPLSWRRVDGPRALRGTRHWRAISLLVSSKPGFTHDPEAFESNGIPLTAQDFIVVKSGYHFELNFKGLATPILVRTPASVTTRRA